MLRVLRRAFWANTVHTTFTRPTKTDFLEKKGINHVFDDCETHAEKGNCAQDTAAMDRMQL